MSDTTNELLYPSELADARRELNEASRMGWYDKLRYGWGVVRTRLVWGLRLHSLGHRSVLGRRQMMLNPRSVAIGSHVTICDGFVFADLVPSRGTLPKIKIGNDATILFRFQCNAAASVIVGDSVLIASNVLVTDSDHIIEPGIPVTRNPNFITRPVVIEHDCWIGQNAVILKGVTVGHHSIVGANSVVTRDVPPYSVAVGNPARVVKEIPHGLQLTAKESSWKP